MLDVKGGATLLATYPAFNETTPNGVVHHAYDYVSNLSSMYLINE